MYPLNKVVSYDKRLRAIDISVVEPDFQKIFNISALEGDLPASLNRPDGLAITTSLAQKIFGDVNVMNKIVNIDGVSLRVTAILPDPPSNTNEPYQALVGSDSLVWPESEREAKFREWNGFSCDFIVKLPANQNPVELNKVLQEANDRFGFNRLNPETGKLTSGPISLVPISDVYFDPHLASGSGEHGNKRTVLGLGLVALLVLVIAATNYINLAIVRTIRRQKEIGLHKVMGASVGHIIRRFVIESVLVALIATALGMLIAWLASPWFSELMARKLDNLFTWQYCCAASLLGILTGVMTGLYPAWIALKVKAAESLVGKGNIETRGGLWMRRALTVIQFSVAMGLAGLTITILWQTCYACNVDPGYDPTNLVVIDMPMDFKNLEDPNAPENLANLAFQNKVSALPGVVGLAGSLNSPGSRSNIHSVETENKNGQLVTLSGQLVTGNFFDFFHLHARAGRLFDPRIAQQESLVVLNWAAAKQLGFASPESAVGQPFPAKDSKLIIIGIAPDIRLESMRSDVTPIVYFRSDRKPAQTPILTVRVNRNMQEIEKQIEAIFPTYFPTSLLVMRSVQDAIAESYVEDVRLAKLLCAASFLALGLAAFGIYVLSAYSVQRRFREIVLRKLYGASAPAIVRLLAREFVGLLLVSGLIGLSVAYFASQRFLADFVERAPMGAWPLFCALVFASIVAAGATMRYLLFAMRVNPGLALRVAEAQ